MTPNETKVQDKTYLSILIMIFHFKTEAAKLFCNVKFHGDSDIEADKTRALSMFAEGGECEAVTQVLSPFLRSW